MNCKWHLIFITRSPNPLCTHVLASSCAQVHMAEEVGLQLPKCFFWSPVHEYIPSEKVLSRGSSCHLCSSQHTLQHLWCCALKWCLTWLMLKDAVGSLQYLLGFFLAFSLASLGTQSQTPNAGQGFRNVEVFNFFMCKIVLNISLRAGKQFLPPQFSFASPIYITLDFPQCF